MKKFKVFNCEVMINNGAVRIEASSPILAQYIKNYLIVEGFIPGEIEDADWI